MTPESRGWTVFRSRFSQQLGSVVFCLRMLVESLDSIDVVGSDVPGNELAKAR